MDYSLNMCKRRLERHGLFLTVPVRVVERECYLVYIKLGTHASKIWDSCMFILFICLVNVSMSFIIIYNCVPCHIVIAVCLQINCNKQNGSCFRVSDCIFSGISEVVARNAETFSQLLYCNLQSYALGTDDKKDGWLSRTFTLNS